MDVKSRSPLPGLSVFCVDYHGLAPGTTLQRPLRGLKSLGLSRRGLRLAPGVLRLATWVALAMLVGASSVRAAELDPAPIKAAAEKSIALLQASGPIFFKKSACVACHHQSLTAMAVGLARKRGFRVSEELARRQSESVAEMMRARRESMLQSMSDGAGMHGVAYTLAGMAAEDYPADPVTDAMVIQLAEAQSLDGRWNTAPDRPPAQYSDFTTTALSVWSMQVYAPEGRRKRFAEQIARAKRWLLTAVPTATEESAFRLLGLGWAGATSDEVKHPTSQLLAQQRADDGGWAQLPKLKSDAYATGQALVALHLGGGIPASHPAYQRGLAYLLDRQYDDGSWLVQTRSRPFQPYFESGIPHGANQWISACATSWAAMALMLTAKPAQTEPRP